MNEKGQEIKSDESEWVVKEKERDAENGSYTLERPTGARAAGGVVDQKTQRLIIHFTKGKVG